jgi:hypothetical protein
VDPEPPRPPILDYAGPRSNDPTVLALVEPSRHRLRIRREPGRVVMHEDWRGGVPEMLALAAVANGLAALGGIILAAAWRGGAGVVFAALLYALIALGLLWYLASLTWRSVLLEADAEGVRLTVTWPLGGWRRHWRPGDLWSIEAVLTGNRGTPTPLAGVRIITASGKVFTRFADQRACEIVPAVEDLGALPGWSGAVASQREAC